MAENPFQRVVGNNPLERRCRRLLGLSLFVVISIGFLWYGRETEQLIQQQDLIRGQLLVDCVLIRTHWPVWATSKDSGSFLQVQANDLQHNEYSWRFLKAQGPDSESQPLEAFERQVLERLLQSPPRDDLSSDTTAPFIERTRSDEQQYEYYQPIYAKSESCIACHRRAVGQPNLAKNDFMAVVKVQFSNEGTQREQRKSRAICIAATLVTAAVAIAASFAIVRQVIFKPLKCLQDPESEHI